MLIKEISGREEQMIFSECQTKDDYLQQIVEAKCSATTSDNLAFQPCIQRESSLLQQFEDCQPVVMIADFDYIVCSCCSDK